MMQGSEWPAPTAPRLPETPRERTLRVLPAVLVALVGHAILGWTLLRGAQPWQRPALVASSASAIAIEFIEAVPPPTTTAPIPPEERADAIPFPLARPVPATAANEARLSASTPAAAPADAAPAVSAAQLFDQIGGVAAELSKNVGDRHAVVPLPGSGRPILEVGDVLKPPPPAPEKIAQAVIRNMMSTRGANNITDFMGITEGRDPGREIQRAHHDGLYLPRGCDDPENPKLSDECLGIPKR
jgi:hypothetical protein